MLLVGWYVYFVNVYPVSLVGRVYVYVCVTRVMLRGKGGGGEGGGGGVIELGGTPCFEDESAQSVSCTAIAAAGDRVPLVLLCGTICTRVCDVRLIRYAPPHHTVQCITVLSWTILTPTTRRVGACCGAGRFSSKTMQSDL